VVVVGDAVVDEDEVEDDSDVGAAVPTAATVVPVDPLLQAAATNMMAAATARTRIDMISLSVCRASVRTRNYHSKQLFFDLSLQSTSPQRSRTAVTTRML